MKNNVILLVAFCFVTHASFTQTASFFQILPENDIRLEKEPLRSVIPERYKTYRLDYPAMKTVLQTAPREFTAEARQHNCRIAIPLADGSTETFAVWETAMMDAELAARNPYIRTFAGKSISNPSRTVRLSYTARGFRAMVMQPDLGIVYVEPYSWNQDEYYIVYDRADIPKENHPPGVPPVVFGNDVRRMTAAPEDRPFVPAAEDRDELLDPLKLKVYRFAVAATGEYSQDHGGTKPLVLSALVEHTNMVSGVYERDIDLRLQLIAATENVIFLDPDTDPYAGNDAGGWLDQNIGVMNLYLNLGAFDIGHVFGRYSGSGAPGVGALGATCSPSKAGGCSTGTQSGDYGNYFLGIVGQEVGHQLSGGHTWNRCNGGGGRFGIVAFEPGSGSTIMSYAGGCAADNIQNYADLYYHSGSIEEIRNFYTFNSGNTCGSFIQTDNNAPVVTLPYQDNFTIPISTPFELDGNATDSDGDVLSYSWEGIDAGPETPLGSPAGNAATFRSLLAKPVSNRYFPKLSTIVSNGSSYSEQLPTYTRDLTFRLLVRDNRSNGGGVGWADVAFKSTASAGPFLVTTPNTISVIWHVGEYANVSWDVANTQVAPVNCQKVNIRLSTDGGLTYPIMLAENVPNDGSHYILAPDNLSTMARVRVDAADNVFFDISNANFKIQQPTQPSFTMGLSNDVEKICLPDNFVTEILSAGVLGFNSPVALDIQGALPPGSTAAFSTVNINPGEASTLSLDLSNVDQEGTFSFNVRAIVAATGDTILRPISLTFVRNDFSSLALDLPADGATGLALIQTLAWNTAVDAETYDVQVSKSPAFDVLLASKVSTAIDTFKIPVLLEKGTAYYWRVRPRNECGIHDWTETNFFSTYADNCVILQANDLPKTISANGNPTIESIITVNVGGAVSNITVKQIDGFHEFFKDLQATLISPQGTQVLLFKDKCGNYNGSFNFSLNDDAINPFYCPPPNNGTAMKPQNPLTLFIGENSTGVWKLRVKDNVSSSGGSLDNFRLEFCASVSLQPPVLVNNNTLQLSPGTNQVISPDLLLADDPNNTHSQLIFTLVSIPQYGILQKNFGGQLLPGAQFTQADLDNGAIRFFDFGANAGPDGFRFVVTDGEGGFVATPKFNINTVIVGTDSPAKAQTYFSLYPNPASDAVWLTLDRAASSETRIRLFDAAGRLVQTETMPAGADHVQVPIGNLPKGMYAVRVENEAGVGTEKLVLR